MAENKKNNVNIKPSDIGASLTQGQIYLSGIWIAAFVIVTVLNVLGIICAVIYCAIPPAEDIEFVIIIFVIIFVIGVVPSVVLYYVIIHTKKKVALWLKDAVILEATCISLGSRPVMRFPVPMVFKAVAIQVNFCYNGECYCRESKYKNKLKVYGKYADKKIMIAYSPKYDEVMLLKEH